MAGRDEMRRDLIVDGLTLAGGIVANIVAAGLGKWPLWVSAPLAVGCTFSVIAVRRRLGSDRLTAQQAAVQLRGALLKFWRSEAKNLGINDGRRLSVRWVRDDSALFDNDEEIARWGRRAARLRVPACSEQDGGLAGRDEELESVWLERTPAGRLVLLGAGGSGKTDLLIAAMERLTGRPGERVPVLVPAASWNPLTAGLDEWVEEWLIANYRFLGRLVDGDEQRTLARALITAGSIDLMVDGLDELPLDARRTALAELSNELSFPYLLVTCREEEYREAISAGGMVRRLSGAVGVRIEDQDPDAVIAYLRAGRPDRWAAFDAGDERVRAAFVTPLMALLADSIYNVGDRDPAELAGVRDVEDFLLDKFVDAVYPGKPEAGPWLRRLARMVLKDQPRSGEIRWWDFGPPRPTPARGLWVYAVLPAVVFVWTAVSAAVLNGFVFDRGAGIVDGLRVGVAALLCYAMVLFLLGSGRAATAAALGAYVVGVISGSYDLAFAGGLAAGFSWRPVGRVRAGPAWAVAVGAVAVGGSVLIRVLDTARALPHEPRLVAGFAAGFADGMVSGWDQDVNGWVATGVIATLMAAVGLRLARHHAGLPGHPVRHPFLIALLLGVGVTVLDAWADSFRPYAANGRLLAPSDGLAVALAVWVAATVVNAPRPRSQRPWIALVVGAAATVLGVVAADAKGDIHTAWARGVADGVAAGFIIWLVLRRVGDSTSEPRAASGSSPAEMAGLILAAAVAAAGMGLVAGQSAGLGIGVVYGLGFGVLILYWLAWRRGLRTISHKTLPFPAIECGMVALAVVGLIAALPYGIIYALLVGLSAKIAQDIAARTEPAQDVGRSTFGILGGAVLAAAVTAASFYAGVARPWLPFLWGSATMVLVVAFGTSGRVATSAVAMSPALVLRRDRAVFWRTVLVVGVGAAVAVAIRASAARHNASAGLPTALAVLVTYGFTAGLIVAFAQTRYGPYILRVWSLAAHGKLPWRLMRFLDEAYAHRVLRRNGNVYRFRHVRLAIHLAEAGRPEPDPPQRMPASARPHS